MNDVFALVLQKEAAGYLTEGDHASCAHLRQPEEGRRRAGQGSGEDGLQRGNLARRKGPGAERTGAQVTFFFIRLAC